MQLSIFAEGKRLEKLSKLGDVLEQLNAIINWLIFTPILDAAIPRIKSEKGGRPPFDNLLMFKVLVIKRLYNLSYDQTEYQINDRISFPAYRLRESGYASCLCRKIQAWVRFFAPLNKQAR